MDPSGQDPGQIPRRERRKMEDREEILTAASRLIAQHGYEQTSMQMIADSAGLSVGTLYLHFQGKEAIYREVLEFHGNLLRECIDNACDRTSAPLDQLRSQLRAGISYIEDNMAFVRFYLSMAECNVVSCREPGHVENLREIERLLAEAMDRGDIAREDPRLVATLIDGAVHWLIEIATRDEAMSISVIPELIDRLILVPLEQRAGHTKQGEMGR